MIAWFRRLLQEWLDICERIDERITEERIKRGEK